MRARVRLCVCEREGWEGCALRCFSMIGGKSLCLSRCHGAAVARRQEDQRMLWQDKRRWRR